MWPVYPCRHALRMELRGRTAATSLRPRSRLSRIFRPPRKQPVPADDRSREINGLPIIQARLLAQHLEGVELIHAMTLHEDALDALGQRAPAECA